jgi:hypothetical protein
VNTTSWDEKRDLLHRTFLAGGDLYLHEFLTRAENDWDPDDEDWEWYTEDEVESRLPPPDAQDGDQGPRAVWAATIDRSINAAMAIGCEGLRERAYVLWDMERIQRHDMLRAFRHSPGHASHYRSTRAEDYAEMQESFDARSQVWLAGGSGYWSKGDESRIGWSRQQPKD